MQLCLCSRGRVAQEESQLQLASLALGYFCLFAVRSFRSPALPPLSACPQTCFASAPRRGRQLTGRTRSSCPMPIFMRAASHYVALPVSAMASRHSLCTLTMSSKPVRVNASSTVRSTSYIRTSMLRPASSGMTDCASRWRGWGQTGRRGLWAGSAVSQSSVAVLVVVVTPFGSGRRLELQVSSIAINK